MFFSFPWNTKLFMTSDVPNRILSSPEHPSAASTAISNYARTTGQLTDEKSVICDSS